MPDCHVRIYGAHGMMDFILDYAIPLIMLTRNLTAAAVALCNLTAVPEKKWSTRHNLTIIPTCGRSRVRDRTWQDNNSHGGGKLRRMRILFANKTNTLSSLLSTITIIMGINYVHIIRIKNA